MSGLYKCRYLHHHLNISVFKEDQNLNIIYPSEPPKPIVKDRQFSNFDLYLV